MRLASLWVWVKKMVWGMSLPSSFGQFWPEGGFEGEIDGRPKSGWSERLKTYFQGQTPEVQKELFDWDDQGSGNRAHSYPRYVSDKFINEVGTRENSHMPPFTPIKPHEPPLSFDIERGGKSLASLIKLNGRILAVDEALKEIIERLEPDVHQFFPIEIRLRNGKMYPARYFVLVIGQYFNSFLPENSDKFSWRGYEAEYPDVYRFEETRKGVSGLALSKDVFSSSHLWRERSFTNMLTCFSDELQEEIVKAGLNIPKHYRMRDI